jgi:RimJ/RimL family protein N-acetyltransferase
MNPFWVIRTGRLLMRPVRHRDLPELIALKQDPRVFAIMLGGVRTPVRAAEELAEDIRGWAAHGYGTWAVHEYAGSRMVGIVALQARPDGRGVGLRFAFRTELQGRGYAREAGGAALRFGHERAQLARVVAVARESNYASCMVLGGIGMVVIERFEREGHVMLTYASTAHWARDAEISDMQTGNTENGTADGQA